MIVKSLDGQGQRHLMDREALAQWLSLSQITIRRRCTPVDRDEMTGSLLYLAEECAEQLATVRRLPKKTPDGDRYAQRG